MDVKDLNMSVNDREDIVFEVPKGYECAIEEVEGKSKVVMRKPQNVLKASGLSYDDFELASEYDGINIFTYKQMKAMDALSYIRTHDDDFHIDNIVWDYSNLCYIGWDDINGNISIRQIEASLSETDIRSCIELLVFNNVCDAEKFIQRYSDTIRMYELVCNYYRFAYEY